MNITVEIRGDERVIKGLNGIARDIPRDLDNAIQEAAARYRDHTKSMRAVSARTTGYKAKGMPTDTGRLRSSIRKRRKRSLAAGIFPTVKYGTPVHEGVTSRNVPPRPFFEWSLELGGERKIMSVMKKFLRKLKL